MTKFQILIYSIISSVSHQYRTLYGRNLFQPSFLRMNGSWKRNAATTPSIFPYEAAQTIGETAALDMINCVAYKKIGVPSFICDEPVSTSFVKYTSGTILTSACFVKLLNKTSL